MYPDSDTRTCRGSRPGPPAATGRGGAGGVTIRGRSLARRRQASGRALSNALRPRIGPSTCHLALPMLVAKGTGEAAGSTDLQEAKGDIHGYSKVETESSSSGRDLEQGVRGDGCPVRPHGHPLHCPPERSG